MSFTASPIVSTIPDANVLSCDPVKAIEAGRRSQNQLLPCRSSRSIKTRQHGAGWTNTAGLVGVSGRGIAGDVAPRVVGMLQSQGYALHAPSSITARACCSRWSTDIPAKDLYSCGALQHQRNRQR